MFRIITVEREYGAGGSLVAAELARRRGWQLLDQQLTCEIAKLAAVDEHAVARCEEKCDPLLHRLAKVFWRGSYERSLPISDDKIFDADELVHLAHRVIEKKAEEGNCVIVGRGAPYILRARPDSFHVFVYGSRDKKIQRLIGLKMSEKEATEMVDTIDRERSAFVRRYFNAEWPCRRLYHLMLNSDHGIEHVTKIVLATMDSLERQGKMEPPGKGVNLEPARQPAV
ncbi:MAG TPA: cytidylate kinase-like family protein [Candidatus Binatia bacterium]|nr:cytidylate kinase-like family protein [Candidatus Binatia bacterium]